MRRVESLNRKWKFVKNPTTLENLAKAKAINVNQRTINKIFLKPIIDTGQLLQISQAMGVDFFKFYSELL